MYFDGPTYLVNSSHKANLKWLGRKSGLMKVQEEFPATRQKALNFKKGSNESYAAFKKRLKASINREKRRQYAVVGLTILILFSGLYWLTSTEYSILLTLLK